MKPLQNLVVVDLAGSVAGAYCAKMFADGGATVHVVGQGSLAPHQAAYLRVATVPLAAENLDFSAVDVLIESSSPDPLIPLDIESHDHLVRVQLSPFGQTGPRAHWRSSDLTDYALSGHAYLYGDPARAPLAGPPNQPAIAAGLYGFIGAMAALLARDRCGSGQRVEVSHVQVMVALHQVTLLRWLLNQDVFCRMGNRYTGQGQPNGIYPCQDGWVSIVGVTDPQVEGLLAVTGLMHLLDHPDIETPGDFQLHPALLDEPLTEWLSTQSVTDVVELFQAMRIPTAPVLHPVELLHDPQLVHRNFFTPLPTDPQTKIPGPPFTFHHHQPQGERPWVPGAVEAGPLAGLKVLDLARVWAGPLCARILSDLGADVVWVEAPWNRGPRELPQAVIDSSHHFPNDEAGERPWNRNGHFIKYSLGKQSLAIDLQSPDGQEAFARLVPDAHVLLENFSSRVMPQLGFDEARLHELNPDLIYLTMPGYGRSGPAEHWLAYGSSVDSHAGLSYLIGYPDQTPWKGGVAWPDPIAGLHATAAVLSTLWSSQTAATGGLTIEAAQFESIVAAIGDEIVRAQHRESPAETTPLSERMYRCAGDDEWLAISIIDEADLQRVAAVLGAPDLAAPDLATSDVEDLIETWARTQSAAAAAETLQNAGVIAGKATKAADILDDPHLRARQAWVTVDQPDVGDFTAPVTPISLSRTMPRRPGPAPTLGQHNTELLAASGFTPAEIDDLVESGVVTHQPPA